MPDSENAHFKCLACGRTSNFIGALVAEAGTAIEVHSLCALCIGRLDKSQPRGDAARRLLALKAADGQCPPPRFRRDLLVAHARDGREAEVTEAALGARRNAYACARTRLDLQRHVKLKFLCGEFSVAFSRCRRRGRGRRTASFL